MSGVGVDIFRAAIIGIGGTIVLDLWALFLARAMKYPRSTGRWWAAGLETSRAVGSSTVFGLGMYATAVGLAHASAINV